MLKNKELQKEIAEINHDIHALVMNMLEMKARLDTAIADTRSKMENIEKHITPMHNRLDNMHSDLSRLSFNVQDVIKKNNEK